MPTKERREKTRRNKKERIFQMLQADPTVAIADISKEVGLPEHQVQNDVDEFFTKSKTAAETAQEPGIHFADAPAPLEEKSVVGEAWDSIQNALGLKKETDRKKKPATPLIAKLDAKRQAFVDNLSPVCTLSLIVVASWLWSRLGTEYAQLAPDEKTAERIILPLLRIYARHSAVVGNINPDLTDLGASLVAIVSYMHVSLGMYQKIKEEKEHYESEQINRRYGPSTRENRTDENGDRQPPLQFGSRGDVDAGSADVRVATAQRGTLTAKEQAAYERLSRLAELDYQSRARRSGRAA